MNLFRSILNYNYYLCNKFKLQNVSHNINTVIKYKMFIDDICFKTLKIPIISPFIFDIPANFFEYSNCNAIRNRNLPFKYGKYINWIFKTKKNDYYIRYDLI